MDKEELVLQIIEYTVTAIVCIVSAIVIQRIFIKEKRRDMDAQAIQGIKWFGWAIFVWGLGALINLISIEGFNSSVTDKMLIYIGVLISLLNSLFIILSLPSIQHEFKRSLLVKLTQKFSVKECIGLYAGVLGMITFVFLSASYGNAEISNNFIWLIDIPISIVVAFSLFSELNKAFKSRQMRFMYLPTLMLFVLILIAVSHRIIPQDRAVLFIDQQFWSVMGSITAISFKFLFILLFSILLYSWKFLWEKEEQLGLVVQLSKINELLARENEQLLVANESHLDTIVSLKTELSSLKSNSKIDFSDRQKEVLGYMAYYGKEKSYTEIAHEMHISTDGFQTHIHQIKKMLNISGTGGKEQLINFAKTHNFLKYTSFQNNG